MDCDNHKTLREIDALCVPSSSGDQTYSIDYEDDPFIKLFASSVGLSRSVLEVFEEKNVNFFQLLLCNNDDLRTMGIVLKREQDKILNGVKKFHLAGFKKQTLPSLDVNYFTMADAVNTLTNLSMQLELLISAATYVRKHCCEEAILLPMERDLQYSGILALLGKKSELQSKRLIMELGKVVKAARKLQGEDAFVEADLVTSSLEACKIGSYKSNNQARKPKKILLASGLTLVATMIYFSCKRMGA